jgi:hypothetical protein
MTLDEMAKEADADKLVTYFMLGIDEDGDLTIYRFGAEPASMLAMMEMAKLMLLGEMFGND